MKYLQKCGQVYFHEVLLWLWIYYEGGIAQFCNPLTQKDANTVKFCQDRSTSGSTIFIISGAQRHEQVHSCTCELSISEEIKNITLAYNAGNTEDNCGVEIDIDDKTGGFSCISGDLVVQTIKSVEFSRTTTEETNLCLEISLGEETNSTITVKCYKEYHNTFDTTTTTIRNVETGKHTSATVIGNTTTENDESKRLDAEKLGGNRPDSTDENSALIGGIVGGVITSLIIIIIAVIFICLRRRRRVRKPSRYVTSDDRGDLNSSSQDNTQAADKHEPDKKKLDDDFEVTYNAMYNIETFSDSEKNTNHCDENLQTNAKHTNDNLVITDNVMYNIETSPTKEDHYAVPSQGDRSTNCPFGDERGSQIYHEIESGSPVSAKCDTNW